MAVTWGAWEYSGGNGMRVGIEVNWASVSHGDSSVDADIEIWTENQYSYSDSQKLTYGGSISGSTDFTNNSGGTPVLRSTRDYDHTYSSGSYGSSPGNRTFSVSLSGAYNGVTPSVSKTSAIPARPIDDPDPPTNASASYISDTSVKAEWTNNDTAGNPWSDITLQRRINGGAWSTISSSISGSASSYTYGTTANAKWEFQVKATNSAGSSSYAVTNAVWTSPATPTGAARSGANGANQVITWTNQAGYSEYSTEVWVSQDGGAYTLLTTVASGVATYTHTGPPSAASAWKYKVRHKTTSGALLYGAFSDETSSTSGTVSPPNAPTNLSPSGTVVDPSLSQPLTWTHNPTDGSAQTKYQLRHRLNGSSTWTTTSVTTSGSSSYSLAANTYATAQIVEWQVLTYGTHTDPGPWSASATFNTAVTAIAPDPVKLPMLMDLFTGAVEASTTANEVRDYVMRAQSQLSGGGAQAVDASYNISWAARFIMIALGASDRTFPSGYHEIYNPFGWGVTNKELVANVATLTVNSNTVRARIGDTITVSGVGSPFDGTYVVRETESNKIRYDRTNADITSVASAGSVWCTVTGHGGAANVVPSGGKIPLASWTALYYKMPFGWGAGVTPRKNGVVSVTNKSLTSNVATLTVPKPHYFAIADDIFVSIGDASFDGNYAITGMTPTTISYTKTLANIASTAASGYVKPRANNTFFGNFHLVTWSVDYVVPSDWILLALRNGDTGRVEWGTGEIVDPGYDSATSPAAAAFSAVLSFSAETTTSTTMVALATNTEVAVPKPLSGKLLVTVSGEVRNATAGNSARLGFDIWTGSAGTGTQVLSPSDFNAASNMNTEYAVVSRTVLVTPTNTGTTWYVRLMKKSGSATTATFVNLSLVVQPIA